MDPAESPHAAGLGTRAPHREAQKACTVAIVSDIHYACAAEQARAGYEFQGIRNRVLRGLLRFYRHFFWMREPLKQGRLLEPFLAEVEADYLVANGDFSCDSGFIGACDPAAGESVRECLGRLRQKFGANFRATFGDHELGKISFFGGQGGMRLASWKFSTEVLGMEPFWQMDIGRYVLMGITSSVVALPVFEPDTIPEERPEWERLRRAHMAEICRAFSALSAERKVLLFCHDPTALPFLWEEEAVRSRIGQVERTIIGHLHSKLILWPSRLLAGMPVIRFLGHTARRMSTALNDARNWRPFHVRLCPSLAGIELLKDGGYLTAELDPEARQPARFQFHPLPR